MKLKTKGIKPIKLGVVVDACNASYSRGRRISSSRPAWAKSETLSKKQKGWGMTQVIEHLPSMCRLLISILTYCKRKKLMKQKAVSL
jgi:hypothetical protein